MRPSQQKTLLYCWVAQVFSVLVPKQRGTGYLRQPYGHHHNQELTDIAFGSHCDVFGLDGALEFQVGGKRFHGEQSGRDEFVAEVMPKLERYYGMASREVTQAEYWELHPLSIKTN